MVTGHFCFPEQIIQKTGPIGQTTIPYAAFNLVYKAVKSGSSVVSASGDSLLITQVLTHIEVRMFAWITPWIHERDRKISP